METVPEHIQRRENVAKNLAWFDTYTPWESMTIGQRISYRMRAWVMRKRCGCAQP